MARLLLLLCAFAASVDWGGSSAQEAPMPGVRGRLYESPTHGWILVAPTADWAFADAQSADGIETVQLVSGAGDGAGAYFVSLLDDGRGAEGCVDDIVENLARTYTAAPLQGWADPAIEYFPQEPAGFGARVRVPDPNDPALDMLAYVECRADGDGVLVGSVLLRTARDLDAQVDLPLLSPLMPGEGHTGRPRVDGDVPEQGVLRFLAREFPATAGGIDAFPFSCTNQEGFSQPDQPPPPDRGWFACDGQIANIDSIAATIDLANLALGCASPPASEPVPPECPATPIRPSHAELLRPPAESDGSVLTLQPGESAEVVLWYALPEGFPPLDILYLEPDRQVLAGPTFFSAGGGSRPRVRIAR